MPQSNPANFILRLLDSLKTNEDKIAVVDQNGLRQASYKELYTMACRVAGYLQQKQYPPHSFIGISLPTSLEYVASEIGIWLAGHAIVPMGDKYPQDRIDYIMHHCESPLLINDDVIQTMMKTEQTRDYVLPDEDDINALFYTSGSTGTPKGVIDTFASFRIPPSDESIIDEENITVMGITAPMYFVACKQLYTILLKGGTANIIPLEIIKDIRLFETYLKKHQIEFVFIPPTALAYFHNKSPYLKVVIAASERLSRIASSDFKIYNRYGQTETGGAIFSFLVDKEYENTPIGKPDKDVEYCILDSKGKPVAQGEEGELCVRGQFTTGYYKEPELTKRLYSGGWLHTGDIVYQQPDGNIIYVNRKDWMVKINGQRVEPGEVEVIIKQVDGVENAIVKGFSTKNKQFLSAYYIAKDNVTEDTIREYLRSKLPVYMVPAYFVKMDSFPLLPNGKTDRKSLISPVNMTEDNVRSPYAAPTNNTERQLCKAFEKTLSVDHVGIEDDFFELGGDSIRVMEVQSLCPELALSSQMIYANRTPKKIADACEKTKQVSYAQQKDYLLSQAQLGIYVECMSQQEKPLYNNAILFKLADNIEVNRLARACEAVVETHPYIKTRLFIDEEGHPRQRRNDEEPYYLHVERMNETEFAKLKTQLEQPFHLLSDQLFRIRILETDQSVYLFIDFHHIIFDGTSYNIFLSDLNKAYRGESLEHEVFSGFEVAQEEEMLRQTKVYSDAKEWYLQEFGDLEITSLPLSDKTEQNITFGRQELDLGLDESELKEICRRLNTTPNIFTLSAFGYLLGYYNYSNESLFATIYHGRHDLKKNLTIAMMVKTLPVHITWNRQTSLNALLQATKELVQGCMAHDLFSFAELKAVNRYINSEVIFAYQADLDSPDNIGDEPYTQIPLMNNATGESLTFEVLSKDKHLTLRAEYHSNSYSDAYIRRMMQSYIHLVKTFAGIKDGDVSLMSLPLLSSEDSEKLLAMGYGKEVNRESSETFIQKFRRQVLRSSDAIAVVDKLSSITYAELDRQSDCLAASLVKAGVANDSFVALMLPRRKEFVIAVLAVFKAGGAYVSMDADYPQARIDFMLNDLNAQFLITTSKLMATRDMRSLGNKRHIIMLDQFDFSTVVPPLDYSRPQSLAYIIYTSGTTGNPKGVMIEHHSLCAMLKWLIPMEELKVGDKCALHPSFSFDASIPDLFGPLICGAQVHVIPSALRYDIGAFSRYLAENQITGLTMSTQIGMELLENFDLSLRYLFLGGENLHINKKTRVKVINGYGPTEFTVCSSYHVVDSERSYDSIPIGHPVPGSRSLIVDPEGRLVPWGATGELCLMGPQLARGYWNQEEQTRERFVDCPFLPGEKMYRTGDLVKWSQNGELMFHGRIDNQVKINGYRIELGEIESSINNIPGVQTSAVILNKQNNLQYLLGFYTSDSSDLTPEFIRKRLTESLPSYMVPTRLILLKKMPMTPNGKIDRRQLTEFATNTSLGNDTIEPPTNQREQVLLDLVKMILQTDLIGVTNDLPIQGLSSLNAIKLTALADKKGIKLKVNDILNNKTIRNIVNHGLSFGHWLNEYHPNKPIVVAIQGFSPHQVQTYFDALCSRFSVFFFASLDDYYDEMFNYQSRSEIVARYVRLLHEMLPSDAHIHAFTGHCVGGELAYRCAALWQSETDQSPKLIILNTPLRTDEEVRQLMPSKAVIDQMPPERQEIFNEWQVQHERVSKTLDNVPMPSFKGEVVLFRAPEPFLAVNQLTIDVDDFARRDSINMQRWHELQPQIEVVTIPTNHFTMLEPQYVNLYLDKI